VVASQHSCSATAPDCGKVETLNRPSAGDAPRAAIILDVGNYVARSFVNHSLYAGLPPHALSE